MTEIVGWRIWVLNQQLFSPLMRWAMWPTDGPLVARCNDVEPGHQPPEIHCGCGIWASRYQPSMTWPGRILGLVRLSGKIIYHDNCWKGQYARPVALVRGYKNRVMPEFGHSGRTIQQVADLYGIPCINLKEEGWVDTAKELGAPSTKWLEERIRR